MDDIKWVEPPPDRRRTQHPVGRRQRFVTSLRAHPGQWAQYAPDKPNWASAASAMKKTFPGVEVVTRLRDDGRYDIYARWVGNGSEPS